MTIDWISIAIGAGAGVIVMLGIMLLTRRKKRNLSSFKDLLKESHEHLNQANNNIRELYSVMKDIENA